MHQARFCFILMVTLAVLIAASQATAATVGTCGPPPRYTTIQAAVYASAPGATILVCPGTYPEQVMINKPLTLTGASLTAASGAVIVSPAGGLSGNATSFSSGNPIAAQILVQNTTRVTINNLTVDGSNNQVNTCGPPTVVGIFYQNASGTVTNNAVFNQRLGPGYEGCQNGLGIFVQSGSGGSSNVAIATNVVQGYQKNGITGNEAGTRITVTSNNVTGQGATTGAAENGVQIGFGATGSITLNSTLDDVWAPDTISDPGDAAAGILVYASSNVLISGNTVGNTQYGIAVVTDASEGVADNNQILQNRVNATHIFDAIDVCSNRNLIQGNILSGSDESGVHLDSSCGFTGNLNRVNANVVNSACAGILLGSGTIGNLLLNNTLYNVSSTIMNGDQCPGMFAAADVTLNAASTTGSGRQYQPVRP